MTLDQVIRVGALFDGISVRRGLQDLTISGGRVAAVHAADGRRVDRDLSGCFALPGLVDAHTHVGVDRDETGDERYVGGGEKRLTAVRRNAAELLGTGVTTIADCGGPDDVVFPLRDDIAAGLAPGPTIRAAGRPISVPGGHDQLVSDLVADGDDPAEAIRRRVRAGADFVKVMLTPGGGATGPHAYFDTIRLRRMVDTAHEAGLRVTVHAHDPEGIARAVEAGVDGIEHCTFLRDGHVLDAPDVLAALADSGTPVCPTNAIDYRKAEAGLAGAPRAALIEGWRRLIAAGVPIVGGSDVGVPEMRFDDYALVPELMVRELGMAPVEALVACTSRAASYVRAAGAGSLVPGGHADVLIVDGDPTTDISDLRRVRGVLKAGTWVPDQMLVPTPELKVARSRRPEGSTR